MFTLYKFEEELQKYGLTTETYEAACNDIDMKQNGVLDLDWSEIREKYDIKLNSDTIRKANESVFGGSFRTAYFKINLYRLLFQMLKKQNLHINQNNPLIKTEPIQAINLFLLKKTS